MRVEQEDDLLNGRAITITAFVAVGLALAFSAWAILLLPGHERRARPSGVFPERALAQPWEVNDIEQEPFVVTSQAERQRAAARRRLDSFGWVDRERRTVHVPIERAIDLYLSREGGR